MELVRTKALDIAYERVGSGPPLVLVHGAAEDHRIWQPQLTDLADEFTVVAWDEPGAGRSSDVPSGVSLADYADCLAAVIESVALGPAHVAGLSWGGTVTLELYRRHPERGHHMMKRMSSELAPRQPLPRQEGTSARR